MSRILLYYRYDYGGDRWFRGDARLRAPLRRLLRGPEKIGGIDLVFLNLCAGLERLGVEYRANLPFQEIRPGDRVGVIGRDRASLKGYDKPNKIVAGVAVAQHPDEWPTLFEEYPVGRYLVHCDWVAAMFRRVYGDRVSTWAVGIDTKRWHPVPAGDKSVDFLVYDKIRWSHDKIYAAMAEPILKTFAERSLSYEVIRYGAYRPEDFAAALGRARALLFLCEHETQGLAYQQAMSSGLPVLAWSPGQWLDPQRFRYGDDAVIPATSVPFFDERCGLTFSNVGNFNLTLEAFLAHMADGSFAPRAYVEEILTLEKCAQDYIDLLETYSVS